MIKNERQYKITKKRIEDWETTYRQLLKKPLQGTPDWVYQAQLASVKDELHQLKAQIREYDAIKSGKKKLADLSLIDDISSLLVKWRIRCKLTQRELAELVDMPEQQIQRYEETNYQSASLATVSHVAKVLRAYNPKSRNTHTIRPAG